MLDDEDEREEVLDELDAIEDEMVVVRLQCLNGADVLEQPVEVDEEVLQTIMLADIELDEYLLLDMLVELPMSLEVTVNIYATDTVSIALLLTEL